MKRISPWIGLVVMVGLSVASLADTVITHAGASYSGQFLGAKAGVIPFTDSSGIEYSFPLRDVQSLVFTATNSTITLRNGRVYSGKYTGADPLAFKDNLGILYEFPLKDVESLVVSSAEVAKQMLPPPAGAKIIPTGAEISIRTKEKIDSDNVSPGQTFAAEVSEDVADISGGVAIPARSPAKLLIRSTSTGGAVHSPDLVLDLDSVRIRGKVHRVYSSEVTESNQKGLGANKRTGEMLGGGAAVGSLLGAILGGGQGAAIGAGVGAGSGFLTQIFTRGRQVKVPSETVLRFRLEQPLVLRPE
ncbi:MAG TPA: hypothetical protein VEI01_02780 [Terriglobales bacterium]|nr:hypothetical protein [Terriglobales bacterium]